MKPRVNFSESAPVALQVLLDAETYLWKCGLNEELLELMRIRVSQMNGCAYCLDMHTKAARANGETEQRLFALSVWRETPFFSQKERVALSWAEMLTDITSKQDMDEMYQALLQFFSEKEYMDLTFAILTINAWNRLTISFEGFHHGTLMALLRAKKRACSSKRMIRA